jgi:hypothetical protein
MRPVGRQGQKELFDFAKDEQGPPEIVFVLNLMRQALDMQAADLENPALTVADCLAMKRAGEKAEVLARGYALEAERNLGKILLEMGL